MASSRKEEERNEKIIRGLMKLPPNRRCINCNSLGPQYICTNFWTFICMTCSGIHREFTHRVKSVSMSKFTSQEVEALQNGGNQRAKEIYLKTWDQQRQRLPDNSNVDKVREFITNVYVDKKYFGGKDSEMPSKDTQSLRNHEDETRRASSYHSYSQSPPYDFQYEERKYGKQAPALTRKPGSDRGLYVGKLSSFICSPTRFSGRAIEDRFANEGSFSRGSDYFVPSGGELVRSATESPNFLKEIGFSSPPVQTSRDVLGGDDHHQRTDLFSDEDSKKHVNRIPRPQRASSLGSFGSFDSNSMSLKSYNSGGLMDVISEPEQAPVNHLDKSSSLPNSSVTVTHSNLSLFEDPVFPQSGSSTTAPIDLFQFSAAQQAPTVDLFQTSLSHSASSVDSHQPAQNFLSSLDLFGGSGQQEAVSTLDSQFPPSSIPKNEGWATFDSLQPVPSPQKSNDLQPEIGTHTFTVVDSRDDGLSQPDNQTSVNASMKWPAFQAYSAPMSSFVSDPWHNSLQNALTNNIAGAQEWDAFGNRVEHFPGASCSKPSVEAQIPCNSSTPMYPSFSYMVSEYPSKNEIQNDASYGGLPSGGQSEMLVGSQYGSSPYLSEATQSHASNGRSTNPFDHPYDSEAEQSDMFMDMSSLQAALPTNDLPAAFYGGVAQPWFPHDPLPTYIPSAQQGSLAFVAGQAPSPQVGNVQTQGPVASIGGNPFA